MIQGDDRPGRTLWLALAALALACAGACGGGSAGPAELRVTSHTPAEARVDPSEPIQIQFAQPVVGEDQVGLPLAQVPATIAPAVPLEAQWIDRQTLVITPGGELSPSTRYRVHLTGELGRRSGGFQLSFVNRPLEVEGVWGVALDRVPPRPTLPIHFNQPVRAGEVAKRCRLIGPPGSVPGLFTVDDPALVAEAIEVEAATDLSQGTDYQLRCEGLSGAGGPEPMLEAFSQLLHTYPTFSVVTIEPSGRDVPADDVEIQILLANPVDVEALRKHLKSSPRIPGLERGALDGDGTTYRAVVNLEVQTDYTIEIKKGLADVFGQELDDRVVRSFRTGDARPRMSLETGIYALEPTAGGYPVWTRSVETFSLACAAVPRGKIVALLTSEMDYDPWYNAQNPDQVKWKELGLRRVEKTFTVADAKNNWHLEKIDLPKVCGGDERGLYLADFGSNEIEPDPDRMWAYRPSRRVLANVTDLGVLIKAGPASGLVWVTSISSGRPVAGASVTVYSPQGKKVWSGVSDARGLVELPGSARLLRGSGQDDVHDYYSYRSQRLIAVVEKGDDLAAVDGNWANGIQIWNFGVSEDRSGAETRVRGLIQSDRGIYRPGETVHFKGLVREIAVGRAPRVPSGAPVRVTVRDSRGATLMEKKLPLTRFGGFWFDLPLTEAAPTGDYQVVATIKKQTFRESFQVEEFRKVAFEVDVTAPVRHAALGDKLLFKAQADFLFGAPVKGAKVRWQVQRRPHRLEFARFPGYGFVDWAARGNDSWWYGGYHDGYLSFVSDGESVTDARGAASFTVRDPQSSFDGPQDYLARAVVTDESDQSVGKQVVMTAHPSEFYLGLHTQEFVQAVDMPFAVNTVALRPDGSQIGTRAVLSFVRQSWDCNRWGSYRSYSSCSPRHTPVLEREITIPATGTGTERILPKEPGEYVIRIQATDSKGAKVSSSSYLWVIGKGEAFWSGDEDARMSLVASKSEYLPGETARIVARTGLKSPTALVTLERNGILSARVIELETASQGIEIPIAAAHAPNVYASVAMVSGRTGEGDRHRPRFKMGVVELAVSSEQNRLEVAIATDKESYQPGEAVSGTVRLTSAGRPVVGEIALSVADEGVLQLIGYRTPDPMKAFFASWGLGVDAATNWNRIARLGDPTGSDLEEGGDGGPAGGEDRVRSRFVSSAFWAPHLTTGADGVARFTFTAPDNLTAFRIMAVAADDGTRFGSGDRRITIAKPLLAKPVLPRFIGEGDRVEVGLVVHNDTGQDGTATVTAKATGVSLATAEQTVKVASGGSARVRFRGRARRAAEARFELAVRMGDHRDALVIAVPIERGLVIDRRTLARGAVGGDGAPGAIEVPLAWDASVLPRDSELVVTVDRTGLAELEPSLKYLIEYPYGCLEQTLSRFVPLAKVKDLSQSLKLDGLDAAGMRTFLRAGAAKVVRHQHGDGHFSLWPSGPTYPHLTVYAVYGLSEAKRAGVAVDERALASGLEAMRRWATAGDRVLGSNADSGTVAMAAYLMAELGTPDTGLNARLYEARRGLPRYGQAFLLMALARARADREQIDTLRDEIIAGLGRGDAVIVRESIDQRAVMGSDVRSTAIALSALLLVAPDHPVIDRLAEGLKKEQLPSGRWRNTQDNLYGLVALADYARSRAQGSAQVVVKAGGKRLMARTVRGGKPLVLRRRLSRLTPGTLTVESNGRALYAVRVSEARNEPASAPVDRGIAITREYLDPDTQEPVTSPRANQLVLVRLTVKTPTLRHYVALRDRLPAGLEPVNSRLATEAGDAAVAAGADRWRRRVWVHVDLRDEGAQVFADYLPAGEHVFEYNARATIPGTFAALPAEVEAMYEPEVRGRTAAGSMVVRR
ncbi:MAG TPA: MG2 domain-containing protein [Kofleriaceae bacterium]|nr:MG2 domain-containing protein [Kofleriaceae bacterium]